MLKTFIWLYYGIFKYIKYSRILLHISKISQAYVVVVRTVMVTSVYGKRQLCCLSSVPLRQQEMFCIAVTSTGHRQTDFSVRTIAGQLGDTDPDISEPHQSRE